VGEKAGINVLFSYQPFYGGRRGCAREIIAREIFEVDIIEEGAKKLNTCIRYRYLVAAEV
jgi:hypothetical protein